MAKKHSIQILLLLVLFCVPVSVLRADGDSDFAFAAGLFRKQRWDYAETAFRKFLKDHPEHERAKIARLYLGLTLSSLEKYGDAHAELKLFIRNNPGSRNLADARYRLGECSYYEGKYEQAITELTDYLRKHESHTLSSWASLMIGESHNSLKQYKKAELVLRPLLTSGVPRNITADVTFALAMAMQSQKESDQAIALFERVVAMQSDAFSSRAQARIGTIYFQNEEYAKSSRAYDLLVEKWPAKDIVPAATLQSAIAQFKLNEYDAALERLKRVPADSSSARRAAFWIGMCYQKLDRLDEARTTLLKVYEDAGDPAMAASVLFKRAQLEALDNQPAKAAQMYLDLATRWPTSRNATDSLINATDLFMGLENFAEARRTFSQLQSVSEDTKTSFSVRLLEARLLIAEGKAGDAIPLLEPLAEATSLSESQMLEAGFHLIRALHGDDQFVRVLEVFAPLKRLFSDPKNPDQHGAIVLAANSALATDDYATAESLAGDYLVLGTKELHADSLATRAVAAGHLKKYPDAKADLERLIKEFVDNSATWTAVRQTGQAAYEHKDFRDAADLFELGIDAKTTPATHAAILIGAAQCYFELTEYDRAIELCQQTKVAYKGTSGEIRAAYIEAFCTHTAGRPKEAGRLYLVLFTQLEEAKDLDPNLVRYLRVSGQKAAAIAAEQNDIAGADATWERVAKAMDQDPRLDDVLNDWALLNMKHSRFDRSDEIFRTLLDRFPESDHAGDARLSLAESILEAGDVDKALTEFQAIAGEAGYATAARETALFHVVELSVSLRKWKEVVTSCDQFEEQFGVSTLRPRVQLMKADAYVGLNNTDEAEQLLKLLRDSVINESIPADTWTDRIWVVMAQLALIQKDYDKVDAVADQLTGRRSDSAFLYQIRFTQGRRWKAKADFPKARQYFQQVIDDKNSAGTHVGAQAQFQIAETLLLQEDYRNAANAYLRVYINHQWDDMKAIAMYQAGQCEERLQQPDAAIRNYQTVVDEFPGSPDAEEAKKRIEALSAG